MHPRHTSHMQANPSLVTKWVYIVYQIPRGGKESGVISNSMVETHRCTYLILLQNHLLVLLFCHFISFWDFSFEIFLSFLRYKIVIFFTSDKTVTTILKSHLGTQTLVKIANVYIHPSSRYKICKLRPHAHKAPCNCLCPYSWFSIIAWLNLYFYTTTDT